ncbi:AraC family transcriptional regulator [Dubosiella newyorkensis]
MGFEDSLHFTKTFTKKLGISPKQYRNLKKEREDSDEFKRT